MGVSRARAREEEPPTEPEERVHRWLRRGDYRVHRFEEDHEGKRFHGMRVVYSFWSATKYVLILSILLWWLPLFGQMIAGYVGGRRAGSPWKGVIAAILPLAMIFVIASAIQPGSFFGSLFEEAFGVAPQPSAMLAAIASGIPLLAPYIQFSTEYLQSFVSALQGQSPYEMNSYILTVAFAYIGGIMAEQSRREIEASAGSVTSHTTIVLPAEPTPAAEAVDPAAYHRLTAPRPHGWLAHLFARHGEPSQAYDPNLVAVSGGLRYDRMRGYLPQGGRLRRRGEEPPPPPPEDEEEEAVRYRLHPVALQSRPSGHQPRLRPAVPEPIVPRGPRPRGAEPRGRGMNAAVSAAYLPQRGHHPRHHHGVPERVDMHDPRVVRKLEKRLDREWGARKGGFIARALGGTAPHKPDHQKAHEHRDQSENHRRRPPNDWETI